MRANRRNVRALLHFEHSGESARGSVIDHTVRTSEEATVTPGSVLPRVIASHLSSLCRPTLNSSARGPDSRAVVLFFCRVCSSMWLQHLPRREARRVRRCRGVVPRVRRARAPQGAAKGVVAKLVERGSRQVGGATVWEVCAPRHTRMSPWHVMTSLLGSHRVTPPCKSAPGSARGWLCECVLA